MPAYLPVKVDLKRDRGTFVFTGNFCSWNCVKRYALRLGKKHKVPSGCYYIGLLAFLTASPALACHDHVSHEVGLCDCLDNYRGVRLALGKEVLRSFGGTMTIDEYRDQFHVIKDYAAVERNFATVQDVSRLAQAAQKSKHAKYWGFQYLHYAGPDASYTTFVNVLPLTNRTIDKRLLVLTGNETSSANTNQMTTADTKKGATQKKKQTAPPRARRINRRTSSSSNTLPSSLQEPMEDQEEAEARDRPLAPATLSSLIHTHNPLHQPFRSSSGPIMTTEQVLACNDEQQFYTNSLRGYGNILTSMGIEISQAPPNEKK